MRILLINYEYPPIGAGAGNATRHLALALRALGHEPIVLTASFREHRGRIMEDGMTVIRLPAMRRHADRASMVEMASFVASGAAYLPFLQERCDAAIVFFSIPCGPLGLLAKTLKRIPYIISLRGGDVPGAEESIGTVHRLLTPLRRMILGQSIAVVANSQGLADLSLNADPSPVEIIPNGVDSEFFRPPAEKKTSEETRILFVGRFQTQKNLSFVLRTFARLRGEAPQKLVLVGDGPLRASLEEEARQLGLSDTVEWRGWMDKQRLRDEYQNADFLVNLSLYEGMPNVILEGMSSGLPALVSDVPGHRELVRSGESGFICPLDDQAGIDTSWLKLVCDKSLRSRMGAEAAEVVRARFTWKSCALSYVGLLEEARPS